ncbi:MAG: hypothetical protein AAGH60_14390 [Pseudomonadota bacterium]
MGVDFGKRRDHSAIAICERSDEPGFAIRHLEQVGLGTRYTAIADHLTALSKRLGHPKMLVDESGVGVAVIEMLIERGLSPIGVTMTGGESARYDTEQNRWVASKEALLTPLEVAMRDGSVRVASGLPAAAALKRELGAFARKGVKMEATKGHDDLVIAVALAVFGLVVAPS